MTIYNEQINNFVRDCRDFLEHLQKFKKQVKIIVPIKEQEVQYYKDFIDFLLKYEDNALKKAQPGDPFVGVLSGDGKVDLKGQLTQTVIHYHIYVFIVKEH